MIIYFTLKLNNVKSGGSTVFPIANIAIKPVKVGYKRNLQLKNFSNLHILGNITDFNNTELALRMQFVSQYGAAFWFNTDPVLAEGLHAALHAGCPVLLGSKWGK